jgi:Kef-type K+ transport system membrane component KefB
MDVRYDQFDVLVNDFTKLNSDILFGTGLGHTLSVDSPVRDYTGNIYFEMQPIYVLNQLGFVVFSLYIFIHVILAKVFIREKELLLLYCCYVLYASSNPYIFDTSHFVVIVVLVSLRKIIDERNLCRSSGLQPQIR